jgi:RimJ/RimL family protein N-acetyltransferase
LLILRANIAIDARQLEQLLRHPAREKLHFYVRNAFCNMQFGRACSHFTALLCEKKLHPVFNRYALLPGNLAIIPGETIQIQRLQAFEKMPPEALAVLYAQSTYSTFSWLRESLRKGGTLWLGYLDHALVAYCCTKRFDLNPERQHDSYLFAVEALSTFRGRNVGTSFVREVCASLFSQGVPRLWSETHVWNQTSNRMHQRLGFKFQEKIRISSRD